MALKTLLALCLNLFAFQIHAAAVVPSLKVFDGLAWVDFERTQSKQIVVFVPGVTFDYNEDTKTVSNAKFENTSDRWFNITSDLARQKEGFELLMLEYPGSKPLQEVGLTLAEYLKNIEKDARIVVLAHSLGGIAAIHALNQLEDYGNFSLITMGCPLTGIEPKSNSKMRIRAALTSFNAALTFVKAILPKTVLPTIDKGADTALRQAVKLFYHKSKLPKLRHPIPATAFVGIAPEADPSTHPIFSLIQSYMKVGDGLAVSLRQAEFNSVLGSGAQQFAIPECGHMDYLWSSIVFHDFILPLVLKNLTESEEERQMAPKRVASSVESYFSESAEDGTKGDIGDIEDVF